LEPRRFVLISKQFWPVSGETELLASAFAEQLERSADSIDVLTWRLIRHWPEMFQFGSSRVIRLPASRRSSWSPVALGHSGRNRWHRGLQRWLASQAARYDAAFVFEFEDDGLSPTIVVARAGIPVVSRVRQPHLAGMPRPLLRELEGLRGSAVAFVTPDQRLMMDPVCQPNGPLQGLTHIPDGISALAGPPRDSTKARAVLARVHPIFQLSPQALLAVSGCDLTFESGVFALVRAWRRVAAEQPHARLWLIGTGRNAPELFQRICDLDLQHSVLLTGNFDDIEDVLAAADVYIMPGSEPAAGWYASVAARQGLTLIHHQNCPLQEISDQPVNSLLFNDASRPLDLVVGHWASARRDAGQETRDSRRVHRGMPESISAMVQDYLKLLGRRLVPR
jgi:glycosyltransferase involved in cell wall biosynthesis